MTRDQSRALQAGNMPLTCRKSWHGLCCRRGVPKLEGSMTNSASLQATREFLISRGPRTVGFPTPDQIRTSIQQLVSENELDQAHQLAAEGLETYPDSEGVLAISALVAIVRQDWLCAVVLLEKLVSIQGDRASELTQMMLERARTCRGNAMPPERQSTAAAAH